MGRWMCKCGHPMDDHNVPDNNLFVVYSDVLWDNISSQTDNENRIDWLKIPSPEYSAYKCPECGRLMIFGKSDRFLSFKPEFDIDDAEIILNEDLPLTNDENKI